MRVFFPNPLWWAYVTLDVCSYLVSKLHPNSSIPAVLFFGKITLAENRLALTIFILWFRVLHPNDNFSSFFFFILALPLNFKNIGYLGAMSKILGIFRKHLLNSSNTYVRPTGWLFVKPETNAVDLVFFFAPDRAPPFPHPCKICTMLLFKSNP